MMILFMLFVLIILIFFLGLVISKKFFNQKEKSSPFESGFTPKFNARLPFSMRFFLITLVFLIFDIELVLMFPFIMNMFSSNIFITVSGLSIFIFILMLGLFHECNQGSLDWVI